MRRDRKWKAELNPDFVGKTMGELWDLIGMKEKRWEDTSLKNIVKFLKYPNTVRPENGVNKSKFYKKDFLKALQSSGMKVDTSNPLYKYYYTHIDDIPDEEVPDQWDWRDVNGVNYMNKARMQVIYNY